MCILHVEQCSDCQDKYSLLQYLEACDNYYQTKLYCEDIKYETKLCVCDTCKSNQSS